MKNQIANATRQEMRGIIEALEVQKADYRRAFLKTQEERDNLVKRIDALTKDAVIDSKIKKELNSDLEHVRIERNSLIEKNDNLQNELNKCIEDNKLIENQNESLRKDIMRKNVLIYQLGDAMTKFNSLLK